MRGFNKELIINGEVYRSPEQQVYENMKNIKELQEKIKDAYKTSAALTSSSVSVAISNTNAPEGTTEGWIMTSDGLLFSITGGDDTNLLLEYYADLKGPQGEDGAALNIDDSTTSATKVWSSQKTNNEIGARIENSFGASASISKTYSQNIISNLISSGMAFTFTEQVDNTLAFSSIYLDGQTADNTTVGGPKLKKGDFVLYVDANLKAATLYYIVGLAFPNAYTYKVCDFGGGKLYQHNIKAYKYQKWTFTLQLITDDNTQFTLPSLFNWLASNGFTTDGKVLNCSGVAWYGSTLYNIMGIGQTTANDNTTAKHLIAKGDAGFLNYYENLDISSGNLTDTVITL